MAVVGRPMCNMFAVDVCLSCLIEPATRSNILLLGIVYTVSYLLYVCVCWTPV